jgi:hypothetical protein
MESVDDIDRIHQIRKRDGVVAFNEHFPFCTPRQFGFQCLLKIFAAQSRRRLRAAGLVDRATCTDRVKVRYEQNEVPSLTLLAVTNRLFRSLARDSDQFMPRGRPFAARDIVGEVRRR